MKRFILVLIAATFALAPVTAASKWTVVADNLQKSVVFLEAFKDGEADGSCTGFIIDSEKHHVLTASHCDSDKILADGTNTYKLFKDDRKDLMVLRASFIDGPALRLAAAPPDRGDEVASMGYGHGLDDPMFRVAHVSNVKMEIEGLSGPFNMVDSTFVPGQSGGPVVNDRGELVGIVQMLGNGFGIGVGSDTIKSRVGKYFGN
jgi:S1-C subfamily serine protease